MRSPNASYLHPKWMVDLEWTAKVSGISLAYLRSGGQVVIRAKEETPPTVAVPSPQRTPAKRTLDCIHLGTTTVKRAGCCGSKNYKACDLLQEPVRSGVECQTCPQYEADQ